MGAMIMALLLATSWAAGDARACRGPFPKPIPVEEAFTRADAVFLGRIEKIEDGLPEDFVPTNAKALSERRESLQKQGKTSLGRTVTFRVQYSWKAALGHSVRLIEYVPENSCEWAYDLAVGDRMIVFAASYGNELGFPAQMFDGRSLYTKRDPSSRTLTREQRAQNRDAIRNEQADYHSIFRALSAKKAESQKEREVPPRRPAPVVDLNWPPKPLTYAKLRGGCAPWDGPTVVLQLSADDVGCGEPSEPWLSFAIQRDLPTGPKDYEVKAGADSLSIRRSSPAGVFIPTKSGSLKLHDFKPEKGGSGRYEVEFKDGSKAEGTFKADWCVSHNICG